MNPERTAAAPTGVSSAPLEGLQRPRVVVFDLGKVLLDFDFGIMARNLAENSRAGETEIQELLDQSPLLHRYETGLTDTRSFMDEVGRRIGFRGTPDAFARCFGDIFTPIEPMIRMQQELHRYGIRTVIFSNTSELAVRHIRSEFPFFSKFDDYVYSYEERAMKPSPASYEAVEKRTGHRSSEILYIDDRLENVDAGAARGWQVIWHREPAESVARVRRHVGPDRMDPAP
ncbi:MAG: HAD family phosphatase [Pedosphaera sp.]|nr:HAD family phosphatase [Pedosphaera sp.]